MAEKWLTEKYCPRCEVHNKKTRCTGQYWGKDEHGSCEYLITCEVCGWNQVLKSEFLSGS